MIANAALTFFQNPLHLSVLIASLALALITFLAWREHGRVRWLYAHLFFLLVPLLDFAIAVPCATPFLQGLKSFCTITYTKLAIYLLPIALLGALLLGFVIAPALYKKMYRAKPLHNKRLEKLARDTNITAHFWLLDTAKPIAFSFGRHVLVSVGMFELLTRKQQDAVVLHELGHVQRQSALNTFSTALARFFSPLAHFTSVHARISAEEHAADDFAVRAQGTARHVNAAKRAVEAFARL